MSAGCTVKMDSFIMTSLNFIPEAALEIIEYGKGNRDLKSALKSQEFITKTVTEVTRFGKELFLALIVVIIAHYYYFKLFTRKLIFIRFMGRNYESSNEISYRF